MENSLKTSKNHTKIKKFRRKPLENNFKNTPDDNSWTKSLKNYKNQLTRTR